jgi:hypothetical protein
MDTATAGPGISDVGGGGAAAADAASTQLANALKLLAPGLQVGLEYRAGGGSHTMDGRRAGAAPQAARRAGLPPPSQ